MCVCPRPQRGHFPTSNQNPSEAEVCELLVALTRAREKCTLVSVRNFGGDWLDDSVFIEWLEPLLDSVTVDEAYFSGHRSSGGSTKAFSGR